jgi:hypothetical protein
MLDSIRHIDRSPVNGDGIKRFIEQLPRWPDKGASSPILDVSWLFSYEHQERRPYPSFAKHRLGRSLVEIAAFAPFSGSP